MRQLILDLAWDPLPPFAGFLAGDNAAAVAQLREQQWPGAPIYLWGPAGSGKTQLLHELQARAVESGLVAQWFDASSPTPWELADDAALVLLDGVDQFDPGQQHAAFTLFVEAASRVGGVFHALAEGVAGAALALAEAGTRDALHQEARRRGIVLGDEVLDYILARFARDLKSLMHLLHRLDGFALAEKRAVTVPLLKRMLDEERSTPE